MSEKKIGIITFHRADNLGAVLQAYALQHTLIERYQAETEIIDYCCPSVEIPRKGSGIKALTLRGYHLWKHWGFERFRKRYLKKSAYHSPQTIDSCVNKYDTFIAGSDQIWNYECSDWDDAYFLNFVPAGKKKYSYAASIGNYQYSESERLHVRDLLDSFTSVSVREDSAKQEFQRIGIDHTQVHPDPVVLLPKEHWMEIMPKRLLRRRYIFVYLIQQDVNVMSSALKYAQEHNCQIINNKTSPEFILHGSPTDFLSWICYAECVFTNSFHGTAFSLIFNKPLAADVSLVGGKINHRVKDMLKTVGAEGCIVVGETADIKTPNALGALDAMRKDACSYLQKICTEP